VCSISRKTSYSLEHFSAIDYSGGQPLIEWEQWAVEDCDSDNGKDMKLWAICGLCKKKAARDHSELLMN